MPARAAYGRARVDELLQPLRNLVEQNDVLQDLTESIALFRAASFFRCYRLPFRVPELIAVADSFYLKPLYPLVETNGRAYLLLLCRNGVKLFWVARKTISELRVPELGHASMPARQLYEEQTQTTLHGGDSAPGRLGFSAHRSEGSGSTRSVSARYVRAETIAVDRFCDYGAPVVLAGPDYLCQSYRSSTPLRIFWKKRYEALWMA